MELRAARKAMGLSYNDVSETTRIQPQFLCAIENLSKSELPSIGYVLGYVRSYAKAVGLDGAEAAFFLCLTIIPILVLPLGRAEHSKILGCRAALCRP